ncbi:MAG: glycosyltransferase [Bdellovibrionales bacterium]|nr:glycosyltransferase [Bdellovibrionales bacterium]
MKKSLSGNTALDFDLLIVRGDVASFTGYSNALRTHVELLKPYFKNILGVNIHPTLGKNVVDPSFEVISDERADAEMLVSNRKSILLNYCLPTEARRNPNAHNISLFYWETNCLDSKRKFPLFLKMMDSIWAPSSYIFESIKNWNIQRPIAEIRWPFAAGLNPSECLNPGPNAAISLDEINSCFLKQVTLPMKVSRRICGFNNPHFWWNTTIKQFEKNRCLTPLSEVFRNSNRPFLSILINAPRKGLPVLLAEWLKFKSVTNDRSPLVIKISNMNAQEGNLPLLEGIWSLTHSIKKRLNFYKSDIFVIFDPLTAHDINALYRLARAYISTTLGEGFGGTIAEAISAGCPVISPRHTSLTKMIPQNHPFIIESKPMSVSLQGQPNIYPISSIWQIPAPGSLSKTLMRFVKTDPEELACSARNITTQFKNYCDIDSMRAALEDELRRIRAHWD